MTQAIITPPDDIRKMMRICALLCVYFVLSTILKLIYQESSHHKTIKTEMTGVDVLICRHMTKSNF